MLSHSEARRFYDRLGARLDTQAFYEAAPLRDLAAHLDLPDCRSLAEFGCGTGRLAAELLETQLSPEATYLGLDVSAVMVSLAKARLRRFGARAEVRQTEGSLRIDAADRSFDRLVSTYVLDLLADADIAALLAEAHRVLAPDGLLGLVSLTNGPTPFSRLVAAAWCGLHRLSPRLVGGCRPIAVAAHLANADWRLLYRNVVVAFGIPSEIVVARALPRAAISCSTTRPAR